MPEKNNAYGASQSKPQAPEKKDNSFYHNSHESQEKYSFIKIPDKILKLKGKKLNAEAILLYGKILSLSQNKGYSWATNRTLADYLNITTRSVQRALKMLCGNKLIEIKKTYYKGSYRVDKRYIKPINY